MRAIKALPHESDGYRDPGLSFRKTSVIDCNNGKLFAIFATKSKIEHY